MKKSIGSLIAITGGASFLLTPAAYAVTSKNNCESGINKNAIHCAYLHHSDAGKYLKIKEIVQGHAASTTIFCAADNNHPLMSIPQYLWNVYKPGQNISWQFTQCADEDCTTGKVLFDDNFTVTKQGKVYSSGPKSAVEVALDPNYGMSCKAEGFALQKHHDVDSSLQMRIDDAVEMMESVPPMLIQSLNTLQQMRALATQASSGTYSSSQLADLDVVFQTYKNQITKTQQVSTLDGIKNIGGGSISIQIGIDSNLPSVLNIPLAQTDIQGLDLEESDILTLADAQNAMATVDTAIVTVEGALALNK